GVAAERRPPSQELVENRTQRIDIGLATRMPRAAPGLLWRHVRRGPQDGPAPRRLLLVVEQELRQPEISDPGGEGWRVEGGGGNAFFFFTLQAALAAGNSLLRSTLHAAPIAFQVRPTLHPPRSIGEKNIRRLEIAVQNAPVMCMLDGTSQRCHQ